MRHHRKVYEKTATKGELQHVASVAERGILGKTELQKKQGNLLTKLKGKGGGLTLMNG